MKFMASPREAPSPQDMIGQSCECLQDLLFHIRASDSTGRVTSGSPQSVQVLLKFNTLITHIQYVSYMYLVGEHQPDIASKFCGSSL